MSTSMSKKRRKPHSSVNEGPADDVENSESERHRYRLRSEYIEVEPPQTEDGWSRSPEGCLRLALNLID